MKSTYQTVFPTKAFIRLHGLLSRLGIAPEVYRIWSMSGFVMDARALKFARRQSR